MNRILNILRWLFEARKLSGKNIFSILWDFAHLKIKLGKVAKEEYTNFKLYSASEEFRSTFLPYSQAMVYWKLLNPDYYACLARNKYITHSILRLAGVPTSELYLYYNPELAVTTESQAYDQQGVQQILKQKNIKQCVIKLAQDSAHGDGVIVCHDVKFEGEKCLLQRYDGTFTDLNDVLKDQPLLFESLIVQNKQFAAFNPSSVNTVRIMTALYPNNEVKIVAAFLKIGRNGSDIDNAGGGGNVDCAVDVESGRLYYTIEFNSWNDIRSITHHPDSKIAIEGITIEGWQQIVTKVKEFQARMPQLKIIGWDVAITDNGPMIIELNNWWDPTGQLFIGRGWRQEVVDCYNEWKKRKV